VAAIANSHVLEHAHYGEVGPAGSPQQGNVGNTLSEWNRVLKPRGILMVSVPDLMTMSDLFANARLGPADKFHLMRMMFGGQTTEKDSHLVGFDENILADFLASGGFCRIRRVAGFNGFKGVDWEDTSEMVWHAAKISINVIAEKCFDV